MQSFTITLADGATLTLPANSLESLQAELSQRLPDNEITITLNQ